MPVLLSSLRHYHSRILFIGSLYGLSICRDLDCAQSRQFVGENGNAGYAASNT
jgi:hypothetical protein